MHFRFFQHNYFDENLLNNTYCSSYLNQSMKADRQRQMPQQYMPMVEMAEQSTGHTHAHYGATNCQDGHTHYVEIRTTENDGHVHIIRGFTAASKS